MQSSENHIRVQFSEKTQFYQFFSWISFPNKFTVHLGEHSCQQSGKECLFKQKCCQTCSCGLNRQVRENRKKEGKKSRQYSLEHPALNCSFSSASTGSLSLHFKSSKIHSVKLQLPQNPIPRVEIAKPEVFR